MDIRDSTHSVPTPRKITGKFIFKLCPRRKTFFHRVNNVENLRTCKLRKQYSTLSRVCPQAQFISHKNMKTYLSRQKKGTFGGLPGVALSRGRDIAGHRKKHSFEHSFSPATQLSPLCVGCLVGCCVGCCLIVMLLSLSSFTLLPRCQHRRRRHRRHAAATATAATAIGRRGG